MPTVTPGAAVQPSTDARLRQSSSAPAAMNRSEFEEALEAWSHAIGAEYVKADPRTRDHYGRTTGVEARRPLAVVYPESTEQVREVLRIASAQGIAVYPISRGKNWGYGDAAPVRENQVVLDLKRMNRIIEVNTQFCYAVIEPGVTQEQLYKYLKVNKTGLWMDSSGAGLDASIVGNILDRGFGHTRYGDHCLTTCGMQVVLAGGEVLNTGMGHYPGARAHRTYRYGTGPFLDGIFTQSNFGVVTQVGVWLMPEPEAFSAFFLSAGEESLPDLVDRLAPLRLQGILQSTIHVGNDLRVLSGRMRYPWDRAGGRAPLPRELRAALCAEGAIGAWNVAGAIYGSRATVAATRKLLKRTLSKYRVTFLNDRTLALAGRVQRFLSRFGLANGLGARLESVKPVYGLLKGIPTDEPLHGAQWRVRGPVNPDSADPLDCNSGLMWVAPVLSASGGEATRLVSLIEPIYEKHGFDALVTFTMITERAMICVTNVAFDRRLPDEVARARACYEELTNRLAGEGYVSYRTGPAGMSKLDLSSSVFWDVSARIKQALDPKGIISPGRYQPNAA